MIEGHATEDYLLTCAAESTVEAIAELHEQDSGARVARALDAGVLLIASPSGFRVASRRLNERPPIFIRHLQPIQVRLALRREAADLERFVAAVGPLLGEAAGAGPAAVQARLFDRSLPYRPFEVNARLAAVLAEHGLAIDVRRPQLVLSVACTADEALIGLSSVRENLSDWAGGAHRLRPDPQQVSRAALKLWEALAVFDPPLPAGGTALDLGGAPGGWVRVLRELGLSVVVVDPGELAPTLRDDPLITHYRTTAEDILPCDRQFDVLTNDMRMAAGLSARVMVKAADCLRPGGLALMTLKLPAGTGRSRLALVRRAIDRLCDRYGEIRARQLFHNRSEVTVCMTRLPANGESARPAGPRRRGPTQERRPRRR